MASAAADPPTTRREATFRALLLAVFLAAMEATIVSTALPRIVAELGGLALYGWVGSAYLLAATVTMPLYGRLADLFGRKPVFQLGLAFFFLGSALCGGARSIALLLAGRAVQGLGAGSIQPVAMTIIGDLYPVEERAKVQGIIGSIWAVAGVAGPFLGALLVDGPGWRWVFWINLPFALLSGVLLHRALHDRPAYGERRGLDLPGAALLIAASVALLLAGEGFLPLATATLGLVAAVAFVQVERRSPAPLLPLPLLVRPEVSISSAAAAASGALLMGFVIYLPLYLQGVRGLAPAASGMVLGPLLVGWPAASTWSIRRVRRVGFRRTAVTGAVLIAVGMTSVSLLACQRAFSGAPVPIPTPAVWTTLRNAHLQALMAALTAADLPSESYDLNEAILVPLENPDAEARWLKGEDVFKGVARLHLGDGNPVVVENNRQVIAQLIAGALGKEMSGKG